MTSALSDAVLNWVKTFTGIDLNKATEPADDDQARMYSAPAPKADSGTPSTITEAYIRGYLLHYDFLPARDGADASAGNCVFADGNAAIADVIAWLEKRAAADGWTPDPALELKTATAVYEERQHAQQMGAKVAEKDDAGDDTSFLLTGIARSNMQDMLDSLEVLRKKGRFDDIKYSVLTGKDRNINNPRMRAALYTVARDLGDDWKKEMSNLAEADALTIRQHVLAEMDEGDFVPPTPPDPVAAPGAKKDDDAPDRTVEVDVVAGKADTQAQYTVKLKASNDDDPPKVQTFPDVEITLHLGAAGAVSIETQVNFVKANVGKLLNLGGKIKVEAKVGLSNEVDIKDAAVGQIAKSMEVKLKAGIEVALTKQWSLEVEIDEGPDGRPQGGLKAVKHF